MFSIPLMGFIIFIVACGLIYLLYMLITSVNLEYEYCFTNGSFDVDAIVNVRKRKRLTEFNAREVEIMAKRSHPDFERYMNNQSYQKVYAALIKTAVNCILQCIMKTEAERCCYLTLTRKSVMVLKSLIRRRLYWTKNYACQRCGII